MAHYIRDDIYDSIVAAMTSLGPDQDRVKTALGEIGDIWPSRIAGDALRQLQLELLAKQGRLRTQGESLTAIPDISAPT